METPRVLSWLIVLMGLLLMATPWLLQFAMDRPARLDLVIGGLIVAILGIVQICTMQPRPTQRLSH